MIRVQVTLNPGEEGALRAAAAKALRVSPGDIRALVVERRSIDARRSSVRLCYTLRVDAGAQEERILSRGLARAYTQETLEEPVPGGEALFSRPVIVGSGPAGVFAAWRLARLGYRPLVLEQGAEVARRVEDTERFFRTGRLLPYSNVQFGEGGAGTFSDGKLNTRINDPRCSKILEIFARCADAPEILTDAKPHVGTDRLRAMLPRLRAEIESFGGAFRFHTRADAPVMQNGSLCGWRLANGEFLPASASILAPGHSARELMEKLTCMGLALEPRPFAMGVRAEQPQSWLDRLQFGAFAGHPALGAASYALSCRVKGTTVHSFCVCPGGYVVNASSEAGFLCVNGMSRAARDSGTLNGALAVTVTPPEGADPLWGLRLQRQVERSAFLAGGGDFCAPAQRIGDFLGHKPTAVFSGLQPSVQPGAMPSDLWEVLPGELTSPLEEALRRFEEQMPGFTADGVLTAVEARTSAPIRILRGETGEALGLRGLYPAGEGAGYAGGILSSAVDGWTQAERLIRRYARPKEGGSPC